MRTTTKGKAEETVPALRLPRRFPGTRFPGTRFPGTRPAARRTMVLLGALSLLVGLLGSAGPTALADDNLQNQKNQADIKAAAAKEQLAGASLAVQFAAATVARVSQALPGAQAAVAEASGALAAARAADVAAADRLRGAEVALDSVTRLAGQATDRLAVQRARIGAIARAAYEAGQLQQVSAVLDATGATDFLERSAFISAGFSTTNRLLADVAQARAALSAEQATLKVAAAQVAALRAQSAQALAHTTSLFNAAANAEAVVAGLIADKEQALNVASAFRVRKEREYQALLAEGKKIAAELAARRNTGGPGIPGKGGLVWPANGPVTSPYGYRSDPFTGQSKFHPGVDIGAPNRSPIWAALGGVVALVETPDQSGGYGNYTCVDHGGGFATCYAHQSQVFVTPGERVQQGMTIGLEGSTGASTGPHLHFETRINGNPVDPMQYY